MEPAIAACSPSEAEAFLRSHVDRIAGRYRGKMIQWNVANEPMRGGTVRQYGWWQKLGENYLDIAFDAAETDAVLGVAESTGAAVLATA